MNISIQVSGIGAVNGKLDAWLQQKTNQIDQAVQGAGIDCQAGAKMDCPVDTGRLRASIQYAKIGQCQCSVGTNVEYAAPVEMGHHTRSGSFVAPRPFLFPNAVKAGKNLQSELQTIFRS